MKKILTQLALSFLLINLALTVYGGVVAAQDYPDDLSEEQQIEEEQRVYDGSEAVSPGTVYEDHVFPGGSALTPYEMLKSIGLDEETGLNQFEYGQHPDAPPDYAVPGVGTLTSPILFAIDLFRYVISSIALLVVIYSAIKLISSSQDEEWDKTKRMLIMGIIGFVVVQLANTAVKDVFFGEQGDAFEDIASAEIYGEEGTAVLRGIIGVIQVFLASIAVLVIVIRGFTVILSAGDEESITKAKNHILYAVVGLLVIGISELVIRTFIFPDRGESLPDIEAGRNIIVMITNFISGFIAIFAFVTLFYGGYKYVVSAGDDEATNLVKRILIAAVIALILAMGAFAAVNTFIGITSP
ncbi:hypothetical protein GF354_06555 [Candidatus Peregrinibacteria bacterium]|nr:hypothetical protein [Candidatus Peregrinibacteria bacterium]